MLPYLPSRRARLVAAAWFYNQAIICRSSCVDDAGCCAKLSRADCSVLQLEGLDLGFYDDATYLLSLTTPFNQSTTVRGLLGL